jgi:hypothetical protein
MSNGGDWEAVWNFKNILRAHVIGLAKQPHDHDLRAGQINGRSNNRPTSS